MTCPACPAREHAEQTTAERIVQHLGTPEGLAAFERLHWLCLTHLRLVLTAVSDDIAPKLIRTHVRRLLNLSESMREYVVKLEAHRAALVTDEEVAAYRQGLVLLVGERYLFRTNPEE